LQRLSNYGEGDGMRIPRSLIALTTLNSALLLVLLVQQFRPAFAESQPPVLRGRGLQIVDSQGRIRASISVLAPENTSGTEQAETVLLRLITERGRPTVKIGASEPTSGLSFAGPTDTKGTYAILEAKGNTSSLKLHSEDGRQQVVSP
jgi:hypothetical protein